MFDQAPPSPEGERFPIETIRSPEGNEASFSPKRGGIITSIKLAGKELLYMDQDTFNNPDVNVKGGIPFLFPNVGPIKGIPENSPLSRLKQHGIARLSDRWQAQKTDRRFTQTLGAEKGDFPEYPYAFELATDGAFELDESFTLRHEVANLGDEDMPVMMGDHGYFPVRHSDKERIKFDFPGGSGIELVKDLWMNDGTAFARNPGGPLRIVIPGLGTLIMTPSPEYDRVWVWSMKGKDFVCIENMMGEEGGFAKNPHMVKPRTVFGASVNFRLEV